MRTVNIHDAKTNLSKLVEQATVEGFGLLTADAMLASYAGPVQLV